MTNRGASRPGEAPPARCGWGNPCLPWIAFGPPAVLRRDQGLRCAYYELVGFSRDGWRFCFGPSGRMKSTAGVVRRRGRDPYGRLRAVLLVLWDIDGTLVDSAGHGRFAFEDAFRAVMGRDPDWVDYAGRTDHQIALSMLNGSHERLPDVLEGLAANLAERRDAIAAEGHIYPGVRETLAALHEREDVVQSLLTGNVEPNAAVKVGAFGLERWLDLEAGAYGSDPHERRSDLVAVARKRAAERYGEPTGAVLVGDTPLDVLAAREAGARAVAVATGFAGLDSLRASEPDALLQDLSDTDAAIRAITAST